MTRHGIVSRLYPSRVAHLVTVLESGAGFTAKWAADLDGATHSYYYSAASAERARRKASQSLIRFWKEFPDAVVWR